MFINSMWPFGCGLQNVYNRATHLNGAVLYPTYGPRSFDFYFWGDNFVHWTVFYLLLF